MVFKFFKKKLGHQKSQEIIPLEQEIIPPELEELLLLDLEELDAEKKEAKNKQRKRVKGMRDYYKCNKCNCIYELREILPIMDKKAKCLKCNNIIRIDDYVNIPTFQEVKEYLKVKEDNRKKAERDREEARIKAEQEDRIKPEEEVRIKAEEEARIKAEEELEIKLHKMAYYIEKYYKTKNDDFKDVIRELCRTSEIRMRGSFVKFTPLSSEKEIKYGINEILSDKEEIKEENFGILKEWSGKYVVKLHEDIQNFYDFFLTKGIKTTYKEILSEFKKIIKKEDFKEQVNDYFLKLKENKINEESEHEIIKEFINYIIEDDDDVNINDSLFKGRLQNRYFNYVPPLLTKFGISYNVKIEDLRNIFNNVIDILIKENVKKQTGAYKNKLERFENELDSSYDMLSKENNYDDVNHYIDHDLLSDYLDEDIDDKK